jgi:hypothetical protein
VDPVEPGGERGFGRQDASSFLGGANFGKGRPIAIEVPDQG